MALTSFKKSTDARLDYIFDWSQWLGDGETIVSESVMVPNGITLDDEEITDAGTSVTAWLTDGTAGKSYSVTCHIVTSGAREDERTIRIDVRNR